MDYSIEKHNDRFFDNVKLTSSKNNNFLQHSNFFSQKDYKNESKNEPITYLENEINKKLYMNKIIDFFTIINHFNFNFFYKSLLKINEKTLIFSPFLIHMNLIILYDYSFKISDNMFKIFFDNNDKLIIMNEFKNFYNKKTYINDFYINNFLITNQKYNEKNILTHSNYISIFYYEDPNIIANYINNLTKTNLLKTKNINGNILINLIKIIPEWKYPFYKSRKINNIQYMSIYNKYVYYYKSFNADIIELEFNDKYRFGISKNNCDFLNLIPYLQLTFFPEISLPVLLINYKIIIDSLLLDFNIDLQNLFLSIFDNNNNNPISINSFLHNVIIKLDYSKRKKYIESLKNIYIIEEDFYFYIRDSSDNFFIISGFYKLNK